MKKRVSILVAVAMLLTLMLPSASAASVSFSDTAGHWAEGAIGTWSGYGVIQGDNGKFRPDDPITRGEMAVILTGCWIIRRLPAIRLPTWGPLSIRMRF
jgi:hypothetical protein